MSTLPVSSPPGGGVRHGSPRSKASSGSGWSRLVLRVAPALCADGEAEAPAPSPGWGLDSHISSVEPGARSLLRCNSSSLPGRRLPSETLWASGYYTADVADVGPSSPVPPVSRRAQALLTQKPVAGTPAPPPGGPSAQSHDPQEGKPTGLCPGLESPATHGLGALPKEPDLGRGRAFPGCQPALGPSSKSSDVLHGSGRHRRQGCSRLIEGNLGPLGLGAFAKVTHLVRTKGPSCLSLVGGHPAALHGKLPCNPGSCLVLVLESLGEQTLVPLNPGLWNGARHWGCFSVPGDCVCGAWFWKHWGSIRAGDRFEIRSSSGDTGLCLTSSETSEQDKTHKYVGH